MLLLNTKTVLNCDEVEYEIHSEEILKVIDFLSNQKYLDCAILYKYQDIVHKDQDQKVLSSTLDNLMDIFEMFDLKNGVDVYYEDGFYIFIIYGQNYSFNGEDYLVTVALKILPFDDNRNFMKLANLFEKFN